MVPGGTRRVIRLKDWSCQSTWSVAATPFGSGSFAKVYLGSHRTTGQQAAVKVMDKQQEGNRADVLAGEVAVLKHLTQHLPPGGHIRLLDAYEDQRNVYLVLELCTGRLLSDLQREVPCRAPRGAAFPMYEPMPEAHVAWVVRQLASALLQLHRVGVTHRDLKPQNVMFASMQDPAGAQLKLIDFGMASLPPSEADSPLPRRPAKGSRGHRRAPAAHGRCGGDGADEGGGEGGGAVVSEIMGSEPFIAPEVLRDQAYSPAVDMWALGVTAYLLRCGSHPFASDEEVAARPVARFSESAWETTSSEGCNAIRALLQPLPRNRLRADQLCAHPWLRTALHPLASAPTLLPTPVHTSACESTPGPASESTALGQTLTLCQQPSLFDKGQGEGMEGGDDHAAWQGVGQESDGGGLQGCGWVGDEVWGGERCGGECEERCGAWEARQECVGAVATSCGAVGLQGRPQCSRIDVHGSDGRDGQGGQGYGHEAGMGATQPWDGVRGRWEGEPGCAGGYEVPAGLQRDRGAWGHPKVCGTRGQRVRSEQLHEWGDAYQESAEGVQECHGTWGQRVSDEQLQECGDAYEGGAEGLQGCHRTWGQREDEQLQEWGDAYEGGAGLQGCHRTWGDPEQSDETDARCGAGLRRREGARAQRDNEAPRRAQWKDGFESSPLEQGDARVSDTGTATDQDSRASVSPRLSGWGARSGGAAGSGSSVHDRVEMGQRESFDGAGGCTQVPEHPEGDQGLRHAARGGGAFGPAGGAFGHEQGVSASRAVGGHGSFGDERLRMVGSDRSGSVTGRGARVTPPPPGAFVTPRHLRARTKTRRNRRQNSDNTDSDASGSSDGSGSGSGSGSDAGSSTSDEAAPSRLWLRDTMRRQVSEPPQRLRQPWAPLVAALAPGSVTALHTARRHTMLLLPQIPDSWRAPAAAEL